MTSFTINLPNWLLIVLAGTLLVQTILSLIQSYYKLKLARLRHKEIDG